MDVVSFDHDELKCRLCRSDAAPFLRQMSGFTLIELMIVIAIIAIIAAIAIPNLIEARKAGNESAAIGTLRTVESAQALFHQQDRDGDGALEFGSLAELNSEGLIDNTLATGGKQAYNFQVEHTGGESMSATAVPATASAGSRNFRVTCGLPPEPCVLRESSSGLPDSTSPVVLASEGDPADPVPPTSPPSGCSAGPSGFTPTTPELQAAADAQISMFFKSMAVAVVDTFDPSLAGLSFDLFANAPSAPVTPVQAVIGSLDQDGNGELGFSEVGPEAFSGAAAVAGVVNAYGSCVNACIAAGKSGSSCETTCGEFVAPDGEVVGILDGMVGALPFMLEIGISCEEDLPSLPLSAFSGDPTAFIAAAFGLGPAVPTLAPPVLGVLAITLSVVGLRRSRRRGTGGDLS